MAIASQRRGRPRQSRRPEESESLVFRVLASLGLSDIAIRLHIERIWESAVSPSVARHLQPVHFSRGKLTIASPTSTWQQQMHFLRATLLQNVNKMLHRPYVTEIALVVRARRRSPLSAPAVSEARALAAAEPKPTPSEQHAAQACASAIADDETRAAFVRVMASQLARQHARAAAAHRSPIHDDGPESTSDWP